MRISQIYPGGGAQASSPTSYGADFVELFNASESAVDVGGWLIAYGGSNPTSNFGCAGCTIPIPAGTVIAPCGYLLIQTSSFSSGQQLPRPDLTSTSLDLRGNGVLAIVSSGTPAGICLPEDAVEDLVGWNGVSCFRGAPAVFTSYLNALVRRDAGMTQTNHNGADFTEGKPMPRNSESPSHPTCLQTPARRASWGQVKFTYR